ncbi:hypothetical protein F5X99DRAFT_430663 [Biscogniauxia marginata]|nr:hypothetical protein F5X99DRAFT_430663 [Biscogniauxia marginata]
MIIITLLAYLAILVSGALTTAADAPELSPIMAPSCDKARLDNLVLSNTINMHYGLNGTHLATVTLDLDFPSVLLEQIGHISAVQCRNHSVTVLFDSPDVFERAKAEWPQDKDFILVTNHQGNCDVENERGIFLANGLNWDNATMKVVANAERKDVHSAASTLEVDFSRLVADHPSKRDITFHKTGLNIAGDVSLPHDMKIFSVDPSFTATANRAHLSDNVTFSGYMKYHIHNHELESLYFDLDAALTADLGLTFDFAAPWDRNLTFSPDALQLAPINIPKILQLGPSLRWAIGVDVGAEAALSVGADVWAQIPDGRLHLDLVDTGASHAEGWTPQHDIKLGQIAQKTTVRASPFVGFLVELALRILGGALDLSGGFTAEIMFVNELSRTKVLNAAPEAGPTSLVVIPLDSAWNRTGIAARDVECASGLEHHTAFDFSVSAFLTEKWDKTLYGFETGVSDTCYT